MVYHRDRHAEAVHVDGERQRVEARQDMGGAVIGYRVALGLRRQRVRSRAARDGQRARDPLDGVVGSHVAARHVVDHHIGDVYLERRVAHQRAGTCHRDSHDGLAGGQRAPCLVVVRGRAGSVVV